MHSYSLMALIEDLMDSNPGLLIDDEKVASTCFNEDDPYWQLFKTSNAGAAQTDLEEQIEEYQDIQAEFKRLQVKVDAKTATEADLLNIVRESGEIQQR